RAPGEPVLERPGGAADPASAHTGRHPGTPQLMGARAADLHSPRTRPGAEASTADLSLSSNLVVMTVEDEVDRIVEAWQRERADLDVTPLGVFSRIGRLSRHLDLARRAAFTSRGLEVWEFDVLSALRRAGEPYQLTPGKLLTQTL